MISDRVAGEQCAAMFAGKTKAWGDVAKTVLATKPIHQKPDVVGERLFVPNNHSGTGSVAALAIYQSIAATGKPWAIAAT